MTRDEVLGGFLDILLHIFFREIRVVGAERVPRSGALVLVGNHVNGLLDPILLGACSGRTVRFLAKAPLFNNPLIAPWLRWARALPLSRRKDEGSDMARNEATFEACEHLLLEGEALVLFPEGISHDLPRLQPLKTGAARIVGRALKRGGRPVILPAGLAYTAKTTFRSRVTVTFGLPLEIADLPWGSGEEPAAVEALTDRLQAALESLTVNAERWEDLQIVEGVRGMAVELAGPEAANVNRLEGTRRLVARFYKARDEHPAELHALVARAKAYVRMLDLLHLNDSDVAREAGFGEALRGAWRRLAVLFFGYPPALFGWLFNFLPYFLTGRLAKAIAKESDIVATAKLYAGLVLFPLFYVGESVLLAEMLGPWWAVGVTALAIPCGLWAMRYYALRESFVHLMAASLTLRAGGEAGPRLRAMRREVLGVLKPLVEMYK